MKKLNRSEEANAAYEKAIALHTLSMSAEEWVEHGNQQFSDGDFEALCVGSDYGIYLAAKEIYKLFRD